MPKLAEDNLPVGFDIFFRSRVFVLETGKVDVSVTDGAEVVSFLFFIPWLSKLTISISLKSIRFFFFLNSTE